MVKNRKERRKEASEKRKENKLFKRFKTGLEWKQVECPTPDNKVGDWVLCYDRDKDRQFESYDTPRIK